MAGRSLSTPTAPVVGAPTPTVSASGALTP